MIHYSTVTLHYNCTTITLQLHYNYIHYDYISITLHYSTLHYIHTYIPTYIHTCMHTYLHMYKCVYIYMYMYLFIYPNIHQFFAKPFRFQLSLRPGYVASAMSCWRVDFMGAPRQHWKMDCIFQETHGSWISFELSQWISRFSRFLESLEWFSFGISIGNHCFSHNI